jgi:FkbM family methyltransferase
VYSLGIGEDASFDLSVIQTYRAQVFAFDPTPRCIEWVEKRAWPQEFHFYPHGIAGHEGIATFYPPEDPDHISHSILERKETASLAVQVPVKRLSEVSRMLGHRRIDVLKMDIEGAEYDVLEDTIEQQDVEIDQILVEFHHFFDSISYEQTQTAIERLNKAGYRVFHVSANGFEVAFIRA